MAASSPNLVRIDIVFDVVDQRYGDAVRQHQRFWLRQGIHAVPSFVLERRYLILGAQDADVFVAALDKITNGEVA
jgi:predicted DsbA family dithiol-disulfide isomerase